MPRFFYNDIGSLMANILTITLNPAIDVTIKVEQLHLGQVNRQQFVHSHPAGKGLNVAQILKQLGHNVWVTGFLGQDNRTMFDMHFQTQGFHADFVSVAGNTRENIKIAEQSGRMTDVNGRGFSVNAEHKQQLLEKIRHIAPQVDAIVLSGSLPQGFELQDLIDLVRTIQSYNPQLAVDTSGNALKTIVQLNPWLIKPNTDELEEAFAESARTLSEQRQLIQKHGLHIEHIIISMGEQGVHWIQREHIRSANTPKVEIQSTVGAGDTLLAGMVHGLLSALSVEETLTQATALASYAVTQIGVALPDEQTLAQLKQQIQVNII